MGILISKFRKKESSFQKLEKIEKRINEIESYSVETQKRQKRFVGNFIVGSLIVFIVGFGVFYLFYFPPTWTERILYSWPLLCFPFLILTVRWILNLYFDRQLNKKSDELFSLRDKKRQTLENVMNNEPYKVALQILDRFSDKNASMRIMKTPAATPAATPVTDRRLGTGHETPQVRNMNYVSPYRPQHATPVARTPNPTPAPRPRSATPTRPLTFPVIDWQKRNVVERMVDYLVGDGPSSRYAMICKFCFRHNGMALQEEFEYSNFVCAYCNKMNPARKLRPTLTSLERNGGSAGVAREEKPGEKTDSSESVPSSKSSDNEEDVRFTPWKKQSDGEVQVMESGSEGVAEASEGEKDVKQKKED
ncbi:endoplasmic reticulum junction formation protein lunapark isoform X2 [Phlebotomus argentipes]|uniref:endoplasmic reticulum junction formation protein lunapark isoform X2 n=1 Tax=Phlebotomus argentipes TaxID=94469 RepID=UPI002892FBF0|nr:endoplasmic reticulum junction formation protein lunapark isoform X2 [Phlebotomus argentipes]